MSEPPAFLHILEMSRDGVVTVPMGSISLLKEYFLVVIITCHSRDFSHFKKDLLTLDAQEYHKSP